MEELKKFATMTVIFYGYAYNNYSGKVECDTFEQKYYLMNWKDEEEARHLIDEIARELHYLSGHGIYSIEVISDDFSFVLSYKDELIPYDDRMSYFCYQLKCWIGETKDFKGIYFTFPRVDAFIPLSNNTGWYETRIQFLQIRRGRYYMDYDSSNPIIQSFCKKLFLPSFVLLPFMKEFEPLRFHREILKNSQIFDVGKIHKRFMTYNKFQHRMKKEKEEKRLQKKIKQAGMIPKEQRKKEKPNQVYVIQMMDDGELVTCKIGVSKTPKKRLTSLQTSNPHKLEIAHTFPAEQAAEAETRLHERYDYAHVNGEWFRLTKEQMAELTQIVGYEQGKFMTNAASS